MPHISSNTSLPTTRSTKKKLQMAEAAVLVAVQKVGDLLFEKISFLQGVKGEVKLLKDELVRMQCFLKDAGEKQAANESVRHWVSEIRDLAHDAEDVVELFSLKVEAPRRRRRWLIAKLACFPVYLARVNSIGEEISRINATLKAIENSREQYEIQPEEVRRLEDPGEWRRRVAPYEKGKLGVGLKKDVEELLSKAVLAGKKRRRTVAAIVGMGGAGKSTLARIVYNHRRVVRGFDCRAWVVVSGVFKEREIIEELVRQVLRWSDNKRKVLEEMEKLKMPGLRQKLYEQLKGRRYFIVVDDIWENQHWESLKHAFPNEDKGSVLLLTSRRQDIPSGVSYVHTMKALDAKKSWKLFLQKAFVDDDNTKGKCPNDLVKIGRQIVEKCEGLPLAITIAGGILSNRRRKESEWEEFLRRMNHHINIDGKSALAVLELSYHNLHAELKACFLCFGFFKEDAVISAKRLLHIWIALGLIPREDERQDSIENTARRCLDELISRNLVHVKEMREGDRAKSLHIHDLLRDISIRRAKEELRFEVLREEAGTSQGPNKPRHRVISSGADSVGYSLERNKRVRSLFYHGEGNADTRLAYWRSFELLRVLEFQDFGLRILPDAVCEVSGLRYLGLRNNLLEKLPTSFGRLKNLEVLDISKNLFVEVPNVLYKMDSLRHLYMFNIKCQEAPIKFHTLKNLRTLSYVQLDGRLLDHLTHMTSLCRLGIELGLDTDVRNLSSSLALLQNLTSLSLRQVHGPMTMQLPGGLSDLDRITQLKLRGAFALPSFSSFPLNMSSLSLVGTWFEEDPMIVLEKLPMLSYLRLDCAYKGEKMVISRIGFPKLEVLVLNGLSKLVEIGVGKGGMLGLRRLEINECLELNILPDKLRSISNLYKI